MINLKAHRRTIALTLVILPILLLLAYVVMNSGPLAPVKVVTTPVQVKSLKPALFGIGTIEARYTYDIGYSYAARVKAMHVDVGDEVQQGALLAEMEPIDLDEKIDAKHAALKAAQASISEAQAKQVYANSQTERYTKLFQSNAVSADDLAAKQQTSAIANATVERLKEELLRATADYEALLVQRNDLRLIAPTHGVVIARNAETGSTLAGGQTVVEMIDPASIWINVRFDQVSSGGLKPGLAATITLRSQANEAFSGTVARVELKADAITEETLAKVTFAQLPTSIPRIGELTEVTVSLPELAPTPVVPNSAIQRIGEQLGVWVLVNKQPKFVNIDVGRADLDGNVQVLDGLSEGDQVIVYSEKEITRHSSIEVVKSLAEPNQ